MTHHWVILWDHLMTHFQYDVFHFRNVQGSYTVSHRLEDYKLLCVIRRSSLDVLFSHRTGMVKNNLMKLKSIHEVRDEVLGLVKGLPDI